MLSDLARSDLLAVIPPGEDELTEGSVVEAPRIGSI
jgi:molybdopterin biosynthesis enzyme